MGYWTEEIPMPSFYPNVYVFQKLLPNVAGRKVLDLRCG